MAQRREYGRLLATMLSLVLTAADSQEVLNKTVRVGATLSCSFNKEGPPTAMFDAGREILDEEDGGRLILKQQEGRCSPEPYIYIYGMADYESNSQIITLTCCKSWNESRLEERADLIDMLRHNGYVNVHGYEEEQTVWLSNAPKGDNDQCPAFSIKTQTVKYRPCEEKLLVQNVRKW